MNVPLIKTARKLNESMMDYYTENKKVKGKNIGIVGLGYREGVKESIYSPSKKLISALRLRNGSKLYGFDKRYSEKEIKKEFNIDYLDDNFDKMDVIFLLNKEQEYKDKLKHLKDKVIDVKNTLK